MKIMLQNIEPEGVIEEYAIEMLEECDGDAYEAVKDMRLKMKITKRKYTNFDSQADAVEMQYIKLLQDTIDCIIAWKMASELTVQTNRKGNYLC